MIEKLTRLSRADQAEIRKWPPYEGHIADLDYALRDGGWLDQYPGSRRVRRLSYSQNCQLVAFSLLTDLAAGDAEFFVAVRDDRRRKGVGARITKLTIEYAFETLQLKRVHLKVRTWHIEAIRLYERIGFVRSGALTSAIQGSAVDFIAMELCAQQWRNRTYRPRA
jgi:diamine N-acetyltransferase